jgi:hypothetical protein
MPLFVVPPAKQKKKMAELVARNPMTAQRAAINRLPKEATSFWLLAARVVFLRNIDSG